jgi:chromosome segregation ATPase
MSERSEIDRMQRELGDEQSKLEALRSQHAASQGAHATAMRERQALLVAHQIAEEKAAEADRKVREVEDRISALSEPIAVQEARVFQLAAELADAEAQEAEGKAQEADAHAVALEHALTNLKPVMTEFVNACGAAGAVVPQSMGIGRTMVDTLRRIENDTVSCAELLRQRAKALREQPPTAMPLTPKVPPKRWQSDLPARFVDWTNPAAARIHAEAKRFQSWWQHVLSRLAT